MADLEYSVRHDESSLLSVRDVRRAHGANRRNRVFSGVMLPGNEVPATTANATGVADLIAHVVRDSSGQIVNGTVDFLVP